MANLTKKNFVILVVLDGWGMAQPSPGNAITQAKTFNMNRFLASFPHTQLDASGQAVGLPRGEDGSTETGHLNLGAGRIVYQDIVRINMSIAEGSFLQNSILKGAIDHAQKNASNLHLMGLVGAGGVHSNMEHLYALIQLAAMNSFDRVFIHLFTDGRDSPPRSSMTYVAQLREVINKEKVGTIASVIGRYYAMDRDRRWNRTAKAYFALTSGKGRLVKNVKQAVDMSYSEGNTDEFIVPSIITNESGKPVALVRDNDAVIFFNFRIDRPRQLTASFITDHFTDESISLEFDPYLELYQQTHIPSRVAAHKKVFDRGVRLKNLYFATMTEYSKSLAKEGALAAFPPETIKTPLGEVLSIHQINQLRAAESEKERFVTFYFNGQKENPFAGEDRLIVPSPKVPTYDLKPEMSSHELTESILNILKDGQKYSFVLINYAAPDMVGHTGNIGAAVRAVEAVDDCLGKLSSFVLAFGGTLLITADHGNVEEMINTQTGVVDTEHSSNPVPFIAVSKKYLGKGQTLQKGILADIAPTILNLLGIEVPPVMTGRNLLEEVKI